ncbi:MAG TPA: radical SAM protein [Bacteroidia bacterium]|nr:radical SAM protein [Bacteroidia bacterium]
MRILFTHSYFLRFDLKQWKQQQPYPPLGTVQAAAVLRENGYEVFLHDVMFEKNAESLIDPLQKIKPDVLVIYDDGFNYLTKMCLTNMRKAAFEMSKSAKASGCKVIVCSSDSTDHYEEYLNHHADFVIQGEGEISLLHLIKALDENEGGFHKTDGIIFKEKNKAVVNPKRKVLSDPDHLPLPAWDLINILPYKEAWQKSSGYFSINMNTTRGCPFHCNWCAKPIYGNRYNSRSPEHVIREIKVLKEKFDFDHIWFCDDIFGLTPSWVNHFADLIKKEKIKIRFKIQSRVDLLLQENNIAALAGAGCETVWVGAESGSQKILNAMEKGITVEQIYESTRLLKKHNIHPSFFLQFGYPGETREDIDATIKMVMELLPHDIGVSVSYPLPGTKFYENVKEQLKEKSNWTDSDELALMFKNTYPSQFYKELHRFIHKSYRTRQGMEELKNIFVNPAKMSILSLKRIAALPFHFTGKYVQQLKMQEHEKALH